MQMSSDNAEAAANCRLGCDCPPIARKVPGKHQFFLIPHNRRETNNCNPHRLQHCAAFARKQKMQTYQLHKSTCDLGADDDQALKLVNLTHSYSLHLLGVSQSQTCLMVPRISFVTTCFVSLVVF